MGGFESCTPKRAGGHSTGSCIAVVITSQPQRAGFFGLGDKSVRMPKQPWIKIGQIRTPSVERIGKKIVRANPQEIAKVIEGLKEMIGA